MSDSTELLALRLALIGVIFLFVLIVAMTMRSGVRMRAPVHVAPQLSGRARGARLLLLASGETGLEPGSEFAVAGQMTLGRDGDCSIVLADSSVSANHARIERTRDGWRLIDLGSTNGTLVDGRAIDHRGVLLRGGELLTVGAISLRFTP